MSSGAHVFRFSLTALFGAVLFAAFGTAAIRFASPLWAGLTMAVTVPLLFAAILGALFRLGQARAFWTGMAVCGWGYLLLVLAPWFEASSAGQHLPTSYVLSYVHRQLQRAGARYRSTFSVPRTMTPWDGKSVEQRPLAPTLRSSIAPATPCSPCSSASSAA